MAIEKGLYAAPVGLSEAALAEPEIEIEIEDPEAVKIGIDGLEIELEPEEETADDFDANLAEFIDDGQLSELAADLLSDFDDDILSRKDWMEAYVKGLKLLGLKREEKTEPWNGACGVFHPMLTEAVVRFQSEAIVETFPAAGPVKTQIMGAIDQLKEDAAARVRDDMNYKLTEEMVEYRPEHEKMLWALPLAGSAFKKVYYDPALGRQVAMFIPAEDIVVPYGASSLETAERVTHVMRKTKNELRKLQVSGFYRDVDLGDPVAVLDDVDKEKAREEGYSAVNDNRYRLLEMQVELDLEGYEDKDKDGEPTGIALPYIVTIEKGTKTILGIRRNWYEDDDLNLKRNHLVHYVYVPGFGFYGFGFIHLIGGYAEAATMIMRQLVDAGTLSNLPGGLKTKGLRIKGDDTPINPGEFRDVDVPSGSIRDNILPLPYKEPSQTLYQLLGNIIDEGRAFASAGDINVSDMSNEAPVGTTLAILERTLKVNTAVQGRLHYAMRQEFKLLKTIIRDYTPEQYEYEPEDGDRQVKQADYDMVEVIPVSDPNASTMAQKIVQYQAVMQLAQQAPQLYDLPLLHRQMIEVLGVKNASKLVPSEDDQVPTDPITENQNILTGKPVKAFMEQNHEAHIQIHTSAIQDPQLMKLMENDPSAPAKQAAAMAHINEHLAFEYRRKIEETLGVQLPTEDENKNMPPEIASEVAALCARAAQQLLSQHQQEAAQEQAQQLAEDPVVQMQQQELQLKQQELERKTRKDLTDAIAKSDQMKIEQARIQAQLQIAGLQTGIKAAKDKEELKGKMAVEGLKIGSQAAKDKAQLAMNLLQQSANKKQQSEQPPPKKGKPK
jgi:hypothetical protein